MSHRGKEEHWKNCGGGAVGKKETDEEAWFSDDPQSGNVV
jgi:hypothetical protein